MNWEVHTDDHSCCRNNILNFFSFKFFDSLVNLMFLKVISQWQPEEPHQPVLEEVPIFHPTEEVMLSFSFFSEPIFLLV